MLQAGGCECGNTGHVTYEPHALPTTSGTPDPRKGLPNSQQQNKFMTYIEEARQIAAQCWCDDETKHIEMDVALAEAVATRIATWMDSAAQFSRNEAFYHGIVTQIGEMFGDAAKTSDDGSIQQDVLALRVPELVAAIIQSNAKLSHEEGWHAEYLKASDRAMQMEIERNDAKRDRTCPPPSYYAIVASFRDALQKGTLQQRLHDEWFDCNLEKITLENITKAQHWRIIPHNVDVPSAGESTVKIEATNAKFSEIKTALEAARHELATLNGLLAADAVAPAETWTIDTTNLLEQLDAVIEPELCESGQLQRIIIGEGPTGKPISAVRIGEPSKELPFCAIPSIRWTFPHNAETSPLAAVGQPRLVRPLPASGEADCPKCNGQGTVARHNADWTCHRCLFHEVTDPDREANTGDVEVALPRKAPRP